MNGQPTLNPHERMSTPRYQPKDYALDPKTFGRQRMIAWREVQDPEDLDRLVASKIQHKYAYLMTARMEEIGLAKRDFIAKAGFCRDQGFKILRGAHVMRLDFIASADRILGNIL